MENGDHTGRAGSPALGHNALRSSHTHNEVSRTTDFLQEYFLCIYNLATCWAKTCAKLGFRCAFLAKLGASPVAQMVENLPAMWETRVQSLGWEDALEKGMATHSSIPAWRIPWTEGHSPWGCKESDTTERLTLSGSSLS